MTQDSDGLQAIFEDNIDDFRLAITSLDTAVTAILAGNLDQRQQATAQRDAHKLAGSLGTFGLLRGSQLAHQLELRFAPSQPAVHDDDEHLQDVVGALRAELDNPREDQITGPSGRTGGSLIDLSQLASSLSDDQKLRRAMLESGLGGTDAAAVTAARVLVVDDEPSVRRALAMILSDAGYDVRDVSSAAQARHAFAHDTIDLLLSDVSMPGETGIDLIRFALCEHPGTATLLISALDDPRIAQLAIDYGAYGYLSKPVRRTEVLIGVMNALRRRDIETRERAARERLEDILALHTSAPSHRLELPRLDCAEATIVGTRGAASGDASSAGVTRRLPAAPAAG